MAFLSWLQTISATSFVGILAFVGTVFGTVFTVVLTNRATSNRLQRQFKEEREREETARLFESRREVFLDAADAITVAMMCIGRLADLNRVTADILKPYEDQVGSIAKVHLLAGPDVGALIVEIGSEVGSAIIELTVSRVPLENSFRQVKVLESQLGKNPNAIGEIAELWRDLLPRQMQFAEECVRRAGILAPMIGEAVLAIRKDLHMPDYVPDFPKLLADTADGQLDHMQTAFARLLSDLNTPPQIRTGPPGTITR